MAKKKKRNAVTMVSLLLVLVALIVFYFWYSNRKTASEDQPESEETISLVTTDTKQINFLHVTNSKLDMKLNLVDDKWVSQDDPNRPINQNTVSSMLSVLADIKAIRIVNEKPEDLAEYGLADPVSYVQATQADGNVLTIEIGDKAVTGEGYYGLVNDDPIVYLLSSSYGTGFTISDTDITEIKDNLSIDSAENITHLSIQKSDGEEFEIIKDLDNTVSQLGSISYPWVILKPYDEACSADSTKVSELLANYMNISFKACVDYNSSDLSLYGLNEPYATIDIGYNEITTVDLDKPVTDETTGEEKTTETVTTPKEYKLYIGTIDEDGNYYATTEGSTSIYTISADTIEKCLSPKPFDIMNKYVSMPNIIYVDHIDIDVDGKAYSMQITNKTVTNEDGKDETQYEYYYNNTLIEEDAFKKVYAKMIAAGYDAEINKDVTTDGVNPYLTISYHVVKDGEEATYTASYLPYDNNFYIVKKGNTASYFADKRSIDDIANAITGLASQ